MSFSMAGHRRFQRQQAVGNALKADPRFTGEFKHQRYDEWARSSLFMWGRDIAAMFEGDPAGLTEADHFRNAEEFLSEMRRRIAAAELKLAARRDGWVR